MWKLTKIERPEAEPGVSHKMVALYDRKRSALDEMEMTKQEPRDKPYDKKWFDLSGLSPSDIPELVQCAYRNCNVYWIEKVSYHIVLGSPAQYSG